MSETPVEKPDIATPESPLDSTQSGTLDIYPIGKGKRILLSLADYFIFFIIAIFVFTVAAFPLSRVIVHSDRLQEETNQNTASQIQLLYDSNLLWTNNSNKNLSTDLDYSQKYFMVSTLQGDLEHNPFYNFYHTVCGQETSVISASYLKHDTKGFFNRNQLDANGLPTFTETYQNEFKPLSDPKNALTSQGKTDYSTFSSAFFLPFYQDVLNDIRSQTVLPSSSPLLAYKGYYENNLSIQRTMDLTLTLACYSTYIFVGAILFVLIPCLNKRGKTIGMMAMGLTRVGDDNLALLPKGERALTSVYFFVLDLSFIPLLPLAYISSITNLFDLPALDFVAIASLLLAFVNMIVGLANKFNKDLVDWSSRSVIVDEESYDQIEKARSYGRK
jgi:predicted Zn-dependent protease